MSNPDPPPVNEADAPVLLFSDQVAKVGFALVNELRGLKGLLPANLAAAARLFESGRDAELLAPHRGRLESRDLLIAGHMLRGLSLLRTGDLHGATAEQHALDQLEPRVAGYLRSCYHLPAHLREALKQTRLVSPLHAEAPDDSARGGDGASDEALDHLAAVVAYVRGQRDAGESDAALELLERLLGALPPETHAPRWRALLAAAYHEKAILLSSKDRLTDAAESLRACVRLTPDSPIPYHDLGFVTSSLGDHDDAIQHFRRAVELDRTEDRRLAAAALRGMGMCYVEKGHLEEAERLFRESLAADPAHEEALGGLTYIDALRRREREDTSARPQA